MGTIRSHGVRILLSCVVSLSSLAVLFNPQSQLTDSHSSLVEQYLPAPANKLLPSGSSGSGVGLWAWHDRVENPYAN
jgi:hypothetical protein